MDNLTPPLLTAIRDLRWSLLSGRSIKESMVNYLRNHHDELSVRLNELWSLKIQGQPGRATSVTSHRELALWDLIVRGFDGQPVLEPLLQLEDEVESAATADLELHLATLPFKALVPLLLFQFPAFVILLVGPLLREMARMNLALVLIFAVLLAAPNSEALSLNATAIRKISLAKDENEVIRAQNAFEAIRIARLACRLQLQEGAIPSSCYQALRLEANWQLHPEKKELRGLLARLDRQCEGASARPNTSVQLASSQFLSPACQRSVARARELWAYKYGTQDNWREN